MPVESRSGSGFLEAISSLAAARVDFIIVGVAGVNFFARNAAAVVETQDLDLLLRPDPANLRAALSALRARGFHFRAGDEPFLDHGDDEILRSVVTRGATLSAEDDSGTWVDLMLSGAGLSWDDLEIDAVVFRIADAEVKVGRLEKLLRSKELSGREKDLEFLRLYSARLRAESGDD